MICPYCNDGGKKCIAYAGAVDCLFRKFGQKTVNVDNDCGSADFLKTYKDVDLGKVEKPEVIVDKSGKNHEVPKHGYTFQLPNTKASRRFIKMLNRSANEEYYMKQVGNFYIRTKRTFFQRLWRKIKSWVV